MSVPPGPAPESPVWHPRTPQEPYPLRNGDYVSLCADHGRAAALFLLSADNFLWNQAKPCITKDGIRYKEMAVHGIEPDGYALLCAAKEMCGGRPGLSLSELGDPEQCHRFLLFCRFINRLLFSFSNTPC